MEKDNRKEFRKLVGLLRKKLNHKDYKEALTKAIEYGDEKFRSGWDKGKGGSQ